MARYSVTRLIALTFLCLILAGCSPDNPPGESPSPNVVASDAFGLVWLNKKQLPLRTSELERKFAQSLGSGLTVKSESQTELSVSWDGWEFSIKAVDGSYFTSQEMDELFSDERLRQNLNGHQAWTSIMLIAAPDGYTARQGYPYLGKLAACFRDEWSLYLYSTELKELQICDDETEKHLWVGLPLMAFGTLREPMMMVRDDDEEMLAAYKQARETWPTFLEFFEEPDGRDFVVLKKFSENDQIEYLWVFLNNIEGSRLQGLVSGQPYLLKNYKHGDAVEFDASEILDWAVIEGRTIHGGYTEKVKDRRRAFKVLGK